MRTMLVIALARRIMTSPRLRAGVVAAMLAGRSGSSQPSAKAEVVEERTGTSLRVRLLQVLAAMVGFAFAGWIAGLVIARRATQGDETTDEFRSVAIMAGKEFRSHAEHLRSGTAITSLGGMELDLREATLDSQGANLELRTTMGGIEVRVPQYWIVEVDQESLGGSLEVDVPSAEDLPEDSPRLHIHAVTRLGGGLVTARED